MMQHENFTCIRKDSNELIKGKHISIQFCGGCNPRYERGVVAKEISDRLVKNGVLASYNRLDADLVIFLSGCSVSCAERYNPIDSDCISVADGIVDAHVISKEKLVDEILSRISDRFAKREAEK